MASAAAFNFFRLPCGGFTIRDGENWVALTVGVVAVGASYLAQASARPGRRGGRAV